MPRDDALEKRLRDMANDPIVGPLCSALLLEAADALSETEKQGSSAFSDFIRNATPEAKGGVYAEVMDKAIERQRSYEKVQNKLTYRLRDLLRGLYGGINDSLYGELDRIDAFADAPVSAMGQSDTAKVMCEDVACEVAARLLRNEIVRLEYPKSMFPQEAEKIGRRQTAFQEAIRFLAPTDNTRSDKGKI